MAKVRDHVVDYLANTPADPAVEKPGIVVSASQRQSHEGRNQTAKARHHPDIGVRRRLSLRRQPSDGRQRNTWSFIEMSFPHRGVPIVTWGSDRYIGSVEIPAYCYSLGSLTLKRFAWR
jgi:hypothetical protein